MKPIAVLLAIFLVTWSGSASRVAAQSIDFDELGEAILEIDPETLLSSLEAPIRTTFLPDGLTKPVGKESPGYALVESFSSDLGDDPEIVGSVSQGFDVDRRQIPLTLGVGVISYVVYDFAIDDDAFSSFGDELRTAFDAQEDIEGEVTQAKIGGENAVRMEIDYLEDGIHVVLILYAVPIGNLILMGTLVGADSSPVEAEMLDPFADDLTIAGAAWLASIANDSTPEDDPLKDKFGLHVRIAA